MNSNLVAWFEIYVDDLDRATAFYQTVFNVELSPLGEPSPAMTMMAFPMDMSLYGAAGALVKMEGVQAGGNSTMVYFGSEDCAIEEARVEAAGGRVDQAKMSIGEFGFISVLTDSEGNRIGLHSSD